eukprot:1066645-Pyramimonas_sp.AAC.1
MVQHGPGASHGGVAMQVGEDDRLCSWKMQCNHDHPVVASGLWDLQLHNGPLGEDDGVYEVPAIVEARWACCCVVVAAPSSILDHGRQAGECESGHLDTEDVHVVDLRKGEHLHCLDGEALDVESGKSEQRVLSCKLSGCSLIACADQLLGEGLGRNSD